MAQQCNIKLDQGSDLAFVFIVRDEGGIVDLTGFKAAMQVRLSRYAPDSIDTLTTDNGRLEINTELGSLTMKFPCGTTEKYPSTSLVFDIEIESEGGEITRVLEGVLTVNREITRVRCGRQEA